MNMISREITRNQRSITLLPRVLDAQKPTKKARQLP